MYFTADVGNEHTRGDISAATNLYWRRVESNFNREVVFSTTRFLASQPGGC